MDTNEEPPVWFKDGLRFSCQPGCRQCCGGAPGFVWVNETEMQRLAAHLGAELKAFKRRYTRQVGARVTLVEQGNGDCVFLNDRGCSVYHLRPQQCRDFPFWPEVTESAEAWLKAAKECPGIDQGELHDAPSIVAILKTQEA
jgi:Fe-S-cluster containining protein